MSDLNHDFPSRKSLRYDKILEQMKELDSSVGVENRKVETNVIQEQSTYSYMRVYLNEEDDTLNSGDEVVLGYPSGGEKFKTTFVSYGKDIGRKRDIDELVDYVPEDDKKVLCLMVNVEHINKNSDNIPFIRSLFKVGRFFEYQLFKYDELVVESKSKKFSFFDIDFG